MRQCRIAGVSSSKRPVFWMIVAVAVACSVLRERAAFATSWRSSERTLLQLCFHVRITYGASQSF